MSVILTITERNAKPVDRTFGDDFWAYITRHGWKPGDSIFWGQKLGIEDEWFIIEYVEPALCEEGELIAPAHVSLRQPTIN